ncbi:MAG TPA: type II secretion system major pseudopilin GspG, partial [Candidatus Cybelea sp.]|nr:type II secretion system major pseudopilin GspG [Candidatus Cybelea sp.]
GVTNGAYRVTAPVRARMRVLRPDIRRFRFEVMVGRTAPLSSTAHARGEAATLACGSWCTSRGFTLLELLVVMVIIGLLVGYVAPRYFSQLGKSEVKVTQAQIAAFEKALDTYRLDVGHYPTTEQGLTALVARPQNEPKWNGPYLQKAVPLDPWGKAYQYKSPGEHGEFDVFSFGKDGQPGGSGEAADITNW